MQCNELISYLNTYLRISEINDISRNGLQVEPPEEINKIAFAVDAALASFTASVREGAGLLIVHHGLFWKEPVMLTGFNYKRVKTLIEGNCGLYAAHLPLDLHPEIGNNAVIAKKLGLNNIAPFGDYYGVRIGFGGELEKPMPVNNFIELFSRVLESEPVMALGNGLCKRIAVISGGAAGHVEEAAREGYDTFITGETSHEKFHNAGECGINVIFGGHYATETFGVKMLQKNIEKKFGVETVFLDLPTGL